MIRETLTYWVTDDKTPTKEDIQEAIKIAKERNLDIKLYWKGPGAKWYPNEIYNRLITSESNVDDIYNSLPKVYGV